MPRKCNAGCSSPIRCGLRSERRSFDYPGLVDIGVIADALNRPDADDDICGPIPLIRLQHDALIARGIKAPRVHYAVFGPDLFEQ
jgi:nitric oxide dioxygenase